MKKICICSSVTFYKQVVDLSEKLEQQGFAVTIPALADIMKESGNFDLLAYQEQFNSDNQARKGELISAGFRNIEISEVVIIANYEKHNQPGYIGPNVLMELAVAFYLGKKIFLLFEVPGTAAYAAEVYGMGATILDDDYSLLNS
jgi:hypothetical protein